MEINNAFDAGVAGLQRADSSIAQSAQRIAEMNVETSPSQKEAGAESARSVEPVNLTEEVVNMKVQELQSQASASVIQTADDMVGTLIDIQA